MHDELIKNLNKFLEQILQNVGFLKLLDLNTDLIKNNEEVQKGLSSPYANIFTINKFILGGL